MSTVWESSPEYMHSSPEQAQELLEAIDDLWGRVSYVTQEGVHGDARAYYKYDLADGQLPVGVKEHFSLVSEGCDGLAEPVYTIEVAHELDENGSPRRLIEGEAARISFSEVRRAPNGKELSTSIDYRVTAEVEDGSNLMVEREVNQEWVLPLSIKHKTVRLFAFSFTNADLEPAELEQYLADPNVMDEFERLRQMEQVPEAQRLAESLKAVVGQAHLEEMTGVNQTSYPELFALVRFVRSL